MRNNYHFLFFSMIFMTFSAFQDAPYYEIKINTLNSYTRPKECSVVSLEPNTLYVVPNGKIWVIYFDNSTGSLIDDSNSETVRYRTISINSVPYKLKKSSCCTTSRFYCTSKEVLFPLRLKAGTKLKFSTLKMEYSKYIQENSVEVCELPLK